MKRNWKQIVGLAFIVAVATSAGAAAATWSTVQDRAAAVPGMKVLLDNDCVRVQYHDVAVGQKVPMHSHPNYVGYTLKPFEARITLPDGTERISKREAGVAYWNEALTHSVENLGSTDIHNLIIELKPGTSCRTPATSEVEKVKPAQIRVYQPGDPKDLLFEAGATAPNSARLLT